MWNRPVPLPPPPPRRRPPSSLGVALATLAVGGALVVGLGAGPAAAQAAEGHFSWDAGSGTLTFAATNARDVMQVLQSEDGRLAVQFFDEVTFDADELVCGPVDVDLQPFDYTCTPLSGGPVRRLVVRSLGGDDTVTVAIPFTLDVGVVIEGGPGNDDLTGRGGSPDYGVAVDLELVGGPGDDVLSGGYGDDVLNGGTGSDQLNGLAGEDTLLGGKGGDLLSGDGGFGTFADVVDGGPGVDKAGLSGDPLEWSSPGGGYDPVTVTLDGVANDGRAGEGDNLVRVEHVGVGGGGRVTGNDTANTVWGYPSSVRVTVAALGGRDTVEGSAFDDRLDGGAGNDRIVGHSGNDVIVGGPGRDSIVGDDSEFNTFGNDQINVRDGVQDNVDCGPGHDIVISDAIDVIAPNCEEIR